MKIIVILLLPFFICSCVSPEFKLYKKKYQSYRAQKERNPTEPACIGQEIKPVPLYVIEQSKKHIIEIVGKNYFEENYEYSDGSAWGYLSVDCDLQFRVPLEYRKLSIFFGEPIEIQIRYEGSEHKFPYVNTVALMKDGELIEPKITKDLAQEIFHHELYQNKDNAEWAHKVIPSHPSQLKLSASLYRCDTESQWCWVYNVDFLIGDGCSLHLSHIVNVVTGQFTLDRTPDEYCEYLIFG